MLRKASCFVLLSLGAAFAGSKKPVTTPTGHYTNDAMEITATPYADKESIKQLLGADLGGYIVVVELKIRPRGDEPLLVDRDDFHLRTDRDGQQSQPFAPSQIAGRGALVVSSTSDGAAVMGNNNGPIWGGIPGVGGQPRRMGGDGGGGMGNSASTESATAKAETGAGEKENPLLAVLKQKLLPDGKITQPISGLLYFPMEGKQKIKDLEMFYKGSTGKFSLRFK